MQPEEFAGSTVFQGTPDLQTRCHDPRRRHQSCRPAGLESKPARCAELSGVVGLHELSVRDDLHGGVRASAARPPPPRQASPHARDSRRPCQTAHCELRDPGRSRPSPERPSSSPTLRKASANTSARRQRVRPAARSLPCGFCRRAPQIFRRRDTSRAFRPA